MATSSCNEGMHMYLKLLFRQYKTINPDLAEAITTLFMLKFGKNAFNIPTFQEYQILKRMNDDRVIVKNVFPGVFDDSENYIKLKIPDGVWYNSKNKPKKPDTNINMMTKADYENKLNNFNKSMETYNKVVSAVFKKSKNIYHIHCNLGNKSNHFWNITNTRYKISIEENEYNKEASFRWLNYSLLLNDRKIKNNFNIKTFTPTEDSIINCCIKHTNNKYTFDQLRMLIEKEINPYSKSNHKYEYMRLYINNIWYNDESVDDSLDWKDNLNKFMDAYKRDFQIWKNKGKVINKNNSKYHEKYSKTDLQYVIPFAISNILERPLVIYHAFPNYNPTLEVGNRVSAIKDIYENNPIILWEYNNNYGNTTQIIKQKQNYTKKRFLSQLDENIHENKSKKDVEMTNKTERINLKYEQSIYYHTKRKKSNDHVPRRNTKNSILNIGQRQSSEQWCKQRNKSINYNSFRMFRNILCMCLLNYPYKNDQLDNVYPFRDLYDDYNSVKLLEHYNYIIQKNQNKFWIKIQLSQLNRIISSIINFDDKIAKAALYKKKKLIKEYRIFRKIKDIKKFSKKQLDCSKLTCLYCNKKHSLFTRCCNENYIKCGKCKQLIRMNNKDKHH